MRLARTIPKQWKNGTATHSLSFWVKRMARAANHALLRMLWCVSITAFEKPVVPEVY